ncbi:MAG: STAS domain-containing protein, partial [Acidimicrobiia bacterium]
MHIPGFAIETAERDGVLEIKLSGELDLGTVDQVSAALDGGDGHDQLVIDTTAVTFIDSTGLAALLDLSDRFGGERFTLIPGERVRRLLEISGTSGFF